MPDSRGSRFALEVLFLIALAVALGLADLRPAEIGGIMLAGWVIVAALEWAAWRERPHYGSGLPPRYYVPQVSLPPAQPLEQVSNGYPNARDEAPTWIASAALREEMLGEWPLALQPARQDEPEREPEIAAVPRPSAAARPGRAGGGPGARGRARAGGRAAAGPAGRAGAGAGARAGAG